MTIRKAELEDIEVGSSWGYLFTEKQSTGNPDNELVVGEVGSATVKFGPVNRNTMHLQYKDSFLKNTRLIQNPVEKKALTRLSCLLNLVNKDMDKDLQDSLNELLVQLEI